MWVSLAHMYLCIFVVKNVESECILMQEDVGTLCVYAYTLYDITIKCQVGLQFTVVLSFSFKCHHMIIITAFLLSQVFSLLKFHMYLSGIAEITE